MSKLRNDDRYQAASHYFQRCVRPACAMTAYGELEHAFMAMLWKVKLLPEDRQELKGHMYIAFCKYVDEYDPKLGIPFGRYIVTRMFQCVRNFARRCYKDSNKLCSIEQAVEAEDRGLLGLCDPIEELLDGYEENGRIAWLRQALPTLNWRHRTLILGRYFQDRSYADLAQELGVKESTVRSHMRHAINRLRLEARSLKLGAANPNG